MTKEQVEIYEYCKKHLEELEIESKNSTFKRQKYGCGTGSPTITFNLERINQDMYSEIFEAVNKAKNSIQKIIDEL
ncbi:hypothetical protein [Flavobacterium caseinilyticum]|uniref:Uncharacterized protein n=1 Tax=Flavobacterium caseinilyticum TaxID=2541732 RepID=A0A4R5AYB1_9FLAO|nr:hypothetical protein [Flavobacterium caseinilyticum]TDD77119.1 hypothetical protein E0F89_05840 [Flavobacterium caseinilyticum]